MKKLILVLAVSILAGVTGSVFGQNRFWVAASASNWNNTANWSTTSGGPGGASVPGATEVAVFNANGLGTCNLDIAPTVAGMTVNGYTGTINFQGNNLTTTGTNQFATGTLVPGTTASLILNTTATTTFSGTTVSVNVSGTTGRLLFHGSTFNGTVDITKTDNNGDFSNGNNVFNGTTTLTNTGDGFILMGNINRDQFNGVTTFNNNGGYRIYLAYNHGGQTTTFANDVFLNTNKSGGTDAWSYLICEGTNTAISFGGNVTFNCAGALQSNHRILQGTGSQATYTGTVTVNLTNSHPSTSINMGANGTTAFNGNIVVNSNGGASGVYFNNSASASSTLAATRTITIGGSGFTAGTLNLPRFTQVGSTAQTLTALSGTASLVVGPNSDFGGDVNFASPRLLLNGAVYRGTATLEKTGASGDFSNGGNTFNGVTTITNSGSDEFVFGNGNADIFNSTTTFNNTGSYRIRAAYNHSGQTTTFNGNVTLNSNKSAGTDSWSFLFGEVNDSNLLFNGSLTINCAGTLRSDHRFLNGTGSVGAFNGPVTINITNAHPSTIVTMGVNGIASYAENIVLTNSGGANGVIFSNNASASSTLAAGKTITVGAGGFSSGSLSLLRFVQTSVTNQTLSLTGTAALTVGPNSQFGGDVNFSSPRLFMNGCSYGGTATLTKSGAGDDGGNGGNIFQGVTTITNSGSGYLLTGNTNADQFNAATTFNVTGSGRFQFAQNHGGQTTTFASSVLFNINKSGAVDNWGILFCEGTNTAVTFGGTLTIQNSGTFESDTRFLNGTGSSAIYNGDVDVIVTNTNAATQQNMGTNGVSTFNQNIQVSNSGGANGVFFNTGASSSSTLAAGRTITIGAGGFTSGTLSLLRFTQTGSTAQLLSPIGTTLLIVGPASQFDGNVTFISPRLLLNGCTFGGTGTFEKTGVTDDASSGGNIFTGVTTITNSSPNTIYLSNGTRDQFLSPTTFNNTGGGRFYFAYSHNTQTTTFNSLTLNSNKSSGTDAWSFFMAEGANTFVTFTGALTLNNAGSLQSNCRFLNGSGSTALYGGPVAINITNSHTSTFIYMGENGISTYNDNISVANTGGSSGMVFNNNATASSTLTGSISSSGYSSGQLSLFRFTQVGAIPQTLTLTTAGTFLRIGPASSFDGSVTFISPRLLLNGATYNGTTYLEKNNNVDDAGQGGNIFNGTTTLVNSGSGYLLTANNFPDIFNGDLTVTNSGSNFIYLAHAVAGNEFNGNIILNNTGSASGIRFSNSATGASTFNAGTNKTITTGGSGFSTGELGLKRFTQTGSSAQTLTLTGSTTQLLLGPTSEFNGNVTFTSPRIFLNGTRYNGTAYLEKTAANNDDGTGGNTFNQTATLVNSGSSYLLTSSTNPDIFNALLILQNNSSSTIRLADNAAGNQFNGNIELNSTSGGGIYFGNNVNGTSTLAAGRTIAVGSSGFITGDIRLIRFTQVGPTPQALNIGGIAILTLGPSSSFGGNVDFRSPQLYLNGTTFSGTSYLEKKGATDNYSNGGNTFVGSATLVHSGSGYLAMALNAPDIFQSDLTATNTGSNVIYLANNVTGNQFNGNITFNSTLGSAGIYIGNNTTASATLGTGASLLTGGLGFSSGELRLKRLTQIGSAAQTLVLTGTALLRIGPASTFNGTLDFRSPQIALDGATYNGITYLEKTGATNNDSNGGNLFLGSTTTIANSGTGYFRFAVNSLDTFGSGDLILSNTGTSTIRMADNVPGTVFNGNIFVNSTFGGGIYFSESGGGTATLAAGKSIAVGGLGFTTGDLRIRRFTQADATTPQTLLMTGTSALIIGPGIAFSGSSDFRAPQVYLNGGTFNGPALIEKTGATDNSGNGNMTFQSTTTLRLSGTGFYRTSGGNTFNGPTSIINNGSNYMLFELGSGSTYNGDLTLINAGSSTIRMDYVGASTFNGNILVNSTSGNGIYFNDSGFGATTFASGKTISTGGTGFTAGELRLPRFTQLGTTAQNITLTGSAGLRLGPATTWNGNFVASAPSVFLDGTTFNGTANTITKTGSTTDASNGNNVFSSGTTTIANTGTGVFRLASANVDDFRGNVIFNQLSGTIQPAYNVNTNFRGDLTVNSSTPIVFGASFGGATFTGTANQTINKTGTASPVFAKLTMNKPSGTVTLNTDARVSGLATFTSGILNTTSTNYLDFADNATAAGASNASFVDGPVRKTGNDAFTFPIGDNTFYRPAAISAPTNTAHFFTAQYFNADHGLGSNGDPSFISITKCEYWQIDRNSGASSNVLVTLSWQEAACVAGYITDPPTVRVTRWNGTSWVNLGNGGTTGTATNGTIVTSAAVTAFNSQFTLASSSLANPLPVELTWFRASVTNSGTGLLEWRTASELNNDRFDVQRSENGIDFTTLGSVDGAGTTNKENDYRFEDTAPILSLVYYRLKQIDFNGEFEYSNIVSLDFGDAEVNRGKLRVGPNPVSSGSYASFGSTDRPVRQTVKIFNSMNQIVREYSDAEGFSTEGLGAGIYIVRNQAGEIFRIVIK
ncbi:MAG: hypothetical protein JNK18_03485 [Cyclobacteriaceae bacterium]|nr:hypothetical protein [Cyclobacteriaceae bacterium]